MRPCLQPTGSQTSISNSDPTKIRSTEIAILLNESGSGGMQELFNVRRNIAILYFPAVSPVFSQCSPLSRKGSRLFILWHDRQIVPLSARENKPP